MIEGSDFLEVVGYVVLFMPLIFSVVFWFNNPYRENVDGPRSIGLWCAVVILGYIFVIHHTLISDIIHQLS